MQLLKYLTILLSYIYIQMISRSQTLTLRTRQNSKKRTGRQEQQQKMTSEEREGDILAKQLFNNGPQFSLESLVTLFAHHYKSIQDYFNSVELQLTKLEGKLSSLCGKFNEIEWKLSKGAYKLKQSNLLNQQLMKINSQIEEKLTTLKTDYENLKKRKYISHIQKKIDQLKEVTHKLEMEHYRTKFKGQEWMIFEDTVDKLVEIVKKDRNYGSVEREIYHQILRELIGVVKGEQKDVGKWVQEKIIENVTLKFKLMKEVGALSTNDQIQP